MKIWNPMAFFISLIMSIVMPLIFATPMGMPIEECFMFWPLRWPVAYFLVVVIVNPVSFKLANKVFGFKGW